MKKRKKRMRQDNLNDITALGGLPLYVIVALIFLLSNQKIYFFHMAAGLVFAYATTTVFRLAYFCERPDKQKYNNILERIDASSFPSLHAMRSTIFAIIIASFFNNIFIAAMLSIAVVAVSATRVMLKRHHRTDVIIGIFFGSIIGLLTIAYVTQAVLDIFGALL